MFPTDNSHLLFYQVKLPLKSAVNLVQRQDKNEYNLPSLWIELQIMLLLIMAVRMKVKRIFFLQLTFFTYIRTLLVHWHVVASLTCWRAKVARDSRVLAGGPPQFHACMLDARPHALEYYQIDIVPSTHRLT